MSFSQSPNISSFPSLAARRYNAPGAASPSASSPAQPSQPAPAQPSNPSPAQPSKVSLEGRFRGVNFWVSTLSLSGDEARVFDVLYRKSHKTPFCIYSRRFFWLHFHQEFFGIGQKRFERFLRKFQALCILILEKKEDGIYMRTFAQPYAQQQELALDIEPQAETGRSLAAHSMCGAPSQAQEVSEKSTLVSEKSTLVSEKSTPVSAPHTPLYKKEKNRKEMISSGSRQAAPASSSSLHSVAELGGRSASSERFAPTATSTTSFFFLSKDEQWLEIKQYAAEKNVPADVASDWFLNRSSVGWIKGRGQRIVDWRADLMAWLKRQHLHASHIPPKQGGLEGLPQRPQLKSQGGAPAQLSTDNYQLSTVNYQLTPEERAEAQIAMQQTMENIKRLEQQMQDPGGRKKAERQRREELLHTTPSAAIPCPSWMEKRPALLDRESEANKEWSFRRDEGAEGELGAARRLGAMCKGESESVVLNMLKQKYPAREDEVLRQEFLRAYHGK